MWTHLYAIGQDLNKYFLREHTAEEAGLTSDAGADANLSWCGPRGERAGGDLLREGSEVRTQLGVQTTSTHTSHMTSGKSCRLSGPHFLICKTGCSYLPQRFAIRLEWEHQLEGALCMY